MKTTNTIYEAIVTDQKGLKYEGLTEAAEKAMDYVVKSFYNGTPISQMILGMKDELGYVLHPQSVTQAFDIIINCEKAASSNIESCLNTLERLDDLHLFIRVGDQLQPDSGTAIKYVLFENKHNLVYDSPSFTLLNGPKEQPVVVTKQDSSNALTDNSSISSDDSSSERGDTYIHLPTKEPMSPTSWYTTEFSFDTHNKKILLYTVVAFATIQLIAWYFKDDDKKDNLEAPDNQSLENEVLNSVSETLYFDHTVIYKLLLGLIPISFLILYKLRYYYYYRLSAALKKVPENNTNGINSPEV